MFPYNKITLLISASLVSAAYPAFAQPTDPETTELSTVVVTEQADTTVTEGSKAYDTRGPIRPPNLSCHPNRHRRRYRPSRMPRWKIMQCQTFNMSWPARLA